MNWFQATHANVSDSLRDFWLQVRAKFTPSEFTREALSTVSRGYVFWMTFLVVWNLAWGVGYMATGSVALGFAYLIIGFLFGIMFTNELMLNMATKTIESLGAIAREQQKLLHEMLTEMESGEFD